MRTALRTAGALALALAIWVAWTPGARADSITRGRPVRRVRSESERVRQRQAGVRLLGDVHVVHYMDFAAGTSAFPDALAPDAWYSFNINSDPSSPAIVPGSYFFLIGSIQGPTNHLLLSVPGYDQGELPPAFADRTLHDTLVAGTHQPRRRRPSRHHAGLGVLVELRRLGW